jgi:opacity protein-like surface antigen
MTQIQIRVLVICLAAVGIALPAGAQTVPKIEVSGGYQFLHLSAEDNDLSESLPKGWYFEVASNLSPALGVVFQVGGNYKTFEESFTFGGITSTATADVNAHEFLGGLRLNARSRSTIVPFAQVLVGAANGSVEISSSTTIPGGPPISFSEEDSGTNFALALGAGVNIGMTDTLGFRAGVDYTRIFEEDAGGNAFRFQVGVVIAR